MSQLCGSLSALTSRADVTSAANAGQPTSKMLPASSAPRTERGCFRICASCAFSLLCPLSSRATERQRRRPGIQLAWSTVATSVPALVLALGPDDSGVICEDLRQIDAAVVPMQCVDAHHALGAVEQRSDLAAARLVGKFLHPVADRDRGIAHDVEPLVDLEDLVEARIDRGEELHLVARFPRRGAFVLEAHVHALAAWCRELPELLGQRLLAGA